MLIHSVGGCGEAESLAALSAQAPQCPGEWAVEWPYKRQTWRGFSVNSRLNSRRYLRFEAWRLTANFLRISALMWSRTDRLSVFSRICETTCFGDWSPQLAPCWK